MEKEPELNKFKHGMVLGKFYPPHLGHYYLISNAISKCDSVTVFVCSLKTDSIPGELRNYWIKTSFPEVNVVHITDDLPQSPDEDINFWNIWVNVVKSNVDCDLDCIFTSELYGKRFSEELGINHVLVDLDRINIPINASKIRNNPYDNWKYIPDIVKPFFIKKVVFVGPESTGKTTTAKILSEYYNTEWVPEYGREYCESANNRKLNYFDISQIASGQLHNEQKYSIKAGQNGNKLLICDTDLIVTQIWSEIMFKSCPEWIIKMNQNNKYDLYLLMCPDIPWEQDGTRAYGHIREYHFDLIKKELDRKKLNYVVVSGDFNSRVDICKKSINSLFKDIIWS